MKKLLFIALLIVVSCGILEKSEDQQNPLIGTWKNHSQKFSSYTIYPQAGYGETITYYNNNTFKSVAYFVRPWADSSTSTGEWYTEAFDAADSLYKNVHICEKIIIDKGYVCPSTDSITGLNKSQQLYSIEIINDTSMLIINYDSFDDYFFRLDN